MQIKDLLQQSKEIWSGQKLSLWGVIVRMWKVFWDLCRRERNAPKDQKTHTDEELMKELWNIIFSTIRWCDDLGYNPEECIKKAMDCQKIFEK